jgi:hypothetical protein
MEEKNRNKMITKVSNPLGNIPPNRLEMKYSACASGALQIHIRANMSHSIINEEYEQH